LKHFYLIRGLIRESAHWGDLPLFLKSHFPGCRISTLDLLGAGEFYKLNSSTSVDQMVAELREQYLLHYEKDEESVIVAISLGGMIAGIWLKNYPDDFKQAVLINSSFKGISPIHQRLRPLALPYLLKVPFLKDRKKEAVILKLVSNHSDVFERTLDSWEKIQKEKPVSFLNALRQLFAASTCKLGEFTPQIPVLVLASTMDRMVSVKCSRAMAQKWNSKIIEHPSAGHDISCDDPEWIVDQLKDFLT
jgi:pimeloyl-ACP methyl ester carboxylesterase